jgi:hypothetical protein
LISWGIESSSSATASTTGIGWTDIPFAPFVSTTLPMLVGSS